MASRSYEQSLALAKEIAPKDIPLWVLQRSSRMGNLDFLSIWLDVNNLVLTEPFGKNRIQRGVVVGQIVLNKRHPQADKLWVADVNVGEEKPRQIVYGGTRELKPDDLVAVALPGAVLTTGDRLRRRNWRGVTSNGMLCSWFELGARPPLLADKYTEVAVFTHVESTTQRLQKPTRNLKPGSKLK